jgi:negative regulator of flagellin synthesis FlgM
LAATVAGIREAVLSSAFDEDVVMLIQPVGNSSIQPVNGARSAPPQGAPAQPAYAGPKADAVAFSGESAQVRRVQADVEAAPDVRAERVAAIKAEIEAGSYQVDNRALAEKLLGVL